MAIFDPFGRAQDMLPFSIIGMLSDYRDQLNLSLIDSAERP